ncbi:ATP-binding cassette domain-containing protein [Brevibacterium sp. XM4083]|uniref:ATP-binding cassette domain-containing protein n=1 Tax=Brevibacterium sp. XM4083 TaxID=2583238 RepID=UPI001125E830|nr:ATP-binding cassette domain-containing protein [Brevibacterium sp. XM4083]MCM1014174.1 ATP-binding cassette domain-containing protein [Brevibacterium sp. XM4083]
MSAVLDLAGVDVTYRTAVMPALSDISLRLDPGRMHAVLGPQGAGTSTLARLTVGLLSEQATVTGHAVVTDSAVMLGDDPEAQLSGMTSIVGDEVQLPSRLHGVAADSARMAAALSAFGLDGLWDRRLDTLSGGQRQLVALAGLLALDPVLLVLDEPALSLDPRMRRSLIAGLRAHTDSGGAVLLTGHQFDDVAEACDAVSFLSSGTLSAAVEPSSLGDAAIAGHGVWTSVPGRAPGRSRDAVALASESAERVPAEPDAGQQAPHPRASGAPVLTIDGLRVERGEAVVLDGVDLRLHPGELVALTGANGAGKSTLLRALLGLLDRRATVTGAMSVHRLGEDISLPGMPACRRAAHLGWVGQDPGTQLSAATVANELRRAAPLPRHRRREREAVVAERTAAVASAMALVGLTEAAEAHPFDLGTARRKDVVIASALITEPAVLLLDEPTQGRDAAAMERLSAVVADFCERGGAVIAVTHDRRWARSAADRIVTLDGGRLVAAGVDV